MKKTLITRLYEAWKKRTDQEERESADVSNNRPGTPEPSELPPPPPSPMQEVEVTLAPRMRRIRVEVRMAETGRMSVVEEMEFPVNASSAEIADHIFVWFMNRHRIRWSEIRTEEKEDNNA